MKIGRRFALFAVAVLFPLLASAGTTEFRVLFDADNDLATGCTVGGMAGVEQVLFTQVTDSEPSASVTRTHRLVCTDGVLGDPIDILTPGWTAGWLSSSGQMLVETRIPFAAFGSTSMPGEMRLGLDGTRGTGSFSALTQPNGDPILFPVQSDRRRAVGFGDERMIVIDGDGADWGMISALTEGTAGSGASVIKLIRAFGFANPLDSFVYFNLNLNLSGSGILAVDDSYTRTQGVSSLSVDAPGVLENDQPNTLPLTAAKVSEPFFGTVTLNPDGSFVYSPSSPSSLQVDSFQYKAKSGSDESNAAVVRIKVLSVNKAPVITTAAANVTVCTGGTATFTAAASGPPPPTVQWSVSTDGGVLFTDIPGATTGTLSFVANTSQNGNQYRATFTNSQGSAQTTATLTVTTPPAVTTQPLSQTICAGSPVTFTAAASGSPTPTVQWQVDGGSGFTNMPGETNPTLTFVTAAADNAKQYRAVFTNACGSATTNAATLTVNVAPAFTTQPVSVTVCTGATASFTIAATGAPAPAIQWRVSTDGGVNFSDIPGETSATLSFATNASQNGNQYRARLTNSCGTLDSNAALLTVNTPPAVTTNPLTQTLCEGAPVTFTAAALGSPTPTVQWQVDSGSGFGDMAGETSTSLTFVTVASQSGYQYRAVFTNTCGVANTTAASLTVNVAPVVTAQPANVTVCAGATANFTATATGTPAPTVQWQVDSGSGFTDIPGATSTTLSFATVAGDNGKQYRAVFTNSCSTATSNAAALRVDTLPVVSTNPLTQTICAGSPVTFTAAATSNAGQTVQWQVDSGSGFTDIPGATSLSLTFTTATGDNGKQYRAVFTNSCGSTNSNAATLVVDTLPVVTTNPVNQGFCAGATATFTAAATSNASDHTVQWQVNSGSGFTNIPGATSTTLSFTTVPSDNGNQYRAVFTTACGSSNTTAATLTIDSAPTVTTNPVSQAVCALGNATFTAAASGLPAPTVQWQVDSGSGFTDIPGATSTTLSFATTVADNGNQYRARFSNSCGANVATTAATLTVDTIPVVTTNPLTQTICAGSPVTFTAAATSNASQTVQWQVDSGSGFTDIAGETNLSLTFVTAAGDNGKQYRAVFTNSCGSANTTAATLIVDTLPAVTTNPLTQTVCAGGTATFTAAATSNANDHTVQWQVDSGSGFTDIPGATSTTLSFSTVAGDNGKQYRAVFTNACGSSNTTAATLTVDTLPVVTTNPLTQTVCAGATATFTAAATSNASDHTVQWQVDSGSGFTDIPGATSTTLSFAAAAGDNGKQYRAVFTTSCGTANTSAATLTVDTLPVVTTNPLTQTVCAGASATFTAAATSNASNHTVQWQVDSGSGFTDIPGETTTTLSFSTVAGDNGKQYRAVFTTSCGSTNTTAATLTVDTLPVVTTNPVTQNVCAGATATFTAAATSNASNHTVQWQVDSGSGFTDIPGATSTTLSFSAAAGDNGKQYRAVFTTSCGSSNTTAATLTVDTLPVVTTNPLTQTVCDGATATFTAAATSNAGQTVQWQVDSGSGFADIPGATSTTLSFSAVAGDNGKQYRAVFTNSCGSVNTTAATLTVNTSPSVSVNPVNSTVCENTLVTFTAAATGSPTPTVQWQVDSGSGFTDIPSATSTTLSFTAVAADNNKQYRAVFTNTCNTANTTAATLTVNTAPAVTTHPLTQSVQSGNSVTFTVAASGSPTPTVQWELSTDGGTNFNPIVGETSTSLTFTAQLSQNGNQYRAVFTNTCGTATTNAATLTVTCPAITPARTGGGTFPAGVFNTVYAGGSFTATGGAGPYTFAVTAGTFPTGLTLASDGTISGTATATGTFNFTVTATDTPSGCTGAAAFSIAINPVANGDTYNNLVNNTQAVVTGGTTTSPTTPFVPLTGVIITNDLPTGSVAAVAATVGTTQGGSVTIAGDGTFIYTPPVTVSAFATDSFNYTIASDTGGTGTPTQATGTVTLNLANRVWYVKNNGGAGNGQSQSSFNTLGAAQTASTAGDIIFVHNGDGTTLGHTAGITLKNNQQLIGEGVALVVNTVTLVPAGTKPQITNLTAASDAVTLADGNTVRGLTVTGATRDGISSVVTHAGFTGDTLTVQNNTNVGVNLISMTGTVTITNSTISSVGNQALTINNGTAAVTVDNTNTINGGTGTSVSVLNRPGAAGAIAIGATISAGRIQILSNTSGTISFTGSQTMSTAANAGITMTTNTGATVSFTGTLNITTTTGSAIAATGGGTLGISGTANVTTGAAATGVNINGVTSSGITFTSVNTTGATTGVSLTSLGNGNVAINGGTINAATAVSLNTLGTSNVTLNNVTVVGTTTGISGATFGTLTIAGTVNVSGPTALALNTGTVSGMFNNVSSTGGTNGVSLNAVTGTWGATAGSLTGASSSTFNVSGGGGQITWGPSISQANAANVVTIASSNSNIINFNGNVSSTGTSTGLSISNSSGTYNFNQSNTFSGAGGITIGPSESGNIMFSTNTTNTTAGTAFNVSGGGGAVTAAITYSGTINKASAGAMIAVDNLDAPGTLTMTRGAPAVGDLNENHTGATGISVINSTSTNITISNASVTFQDSAPGFSASGNTGGTINLPGLILDGNGNKAGMLISGGGTINVNAGVNRVIDLSGGTAAASRAIDGTTTAFTGTLNLTSVAIFGNASADIVTLGGGTLGGTGSTISGANDALVLSGVALTNGAGMTSVSSSGGANGISLTNVTGGPYTISGGSLTSNTGASFLVSGGTRTITYAGTITQSTAAQRAVDIQSSTGGTINFTGAISSTGAGIFANSNGGTTMSYRGGVSLTTTTNAGFTATAGGTVEVCDENPCNAAATGALVNTITTTTGTGLNVANTTISANNLEFRSISANGAANGIVLDMTGTSGSLVVKGNAGSCSSVATCTGGAIQNPTSHGISLNSTMAPSFSFLMVTLTGGQGIEATNLTAGLTLTSCEITNTGNGDNEHALRLFDVSGTVSIQGTDFNNTAEDFININTTDGAGANNAATTINIGTTTACTFTQPNTIAAIRAAGLFAGNGILVQHRFSKNYTINLSNSTFTDIKGFGIQFGSSGSTSTATNCNVNLNNNDFLVTIVNALGNPNNRANTINIQALNTLDVDASITNNLLDGGGGGGIQLGSDNSASLDAEITGNTVSDQFADGILMAVDESATLTVRIDGNNISNTSSDGMEISNAISPDALNATLNATITNNTVTGYCNNLGANAFVGGIGVFGGASAGDNTRVDMRNNNVSGSPSASFADYWIDGSSFGDQIDMKGAGTAAVTEASFLAQPNTAGSPAGQKTFIGNTFYNNNAAIPLPNLTP